MAKGNPNPSPETRFKPGQSGNPTGKSSKQLKAENEAAAIAADLMLKGLSCLQELVEDAANTEAVVEMLMNRDSRGMMKDAQDRAHGTAKQAIDHRHDTSEPMQELMAHVIAKGGRIGGND